MPSFVSGAKESNNNGFILAKCGVTLRSTQEVIDESPTGRFMLNIALSVHQLDNDIKSKTVKDDMSLLASYGWWLSQAPLGLKLKPIVTGEYTNDGKITIDDKNRYSEALEQKRQDLRREIDKLERNQDLNEATIDYVCNFMTKPAKLWKDADLETLLTPKKSLFLALTLEW